jgi:enolase
MILDMKGYEVLDSRGNPTIMCKIKTEHGVFKGWAPSGASTGRHEAWELRDGAKRFFGKGVRKAVENLNKMAEYVVGKDEKEWKNIEQKLLSLDDENKSKFGANTFCALSISLVKAASASEQKEVFQYFGGSTLPIPMLNILNGGKHAGNGLAIQEFMIIPFGARNFMQCMEFANAIYYTLRKELLMRFGRNAINVGDEGGFAPPISKTQDALEFITKAIEEEGLEKKVGIGLDAAASSFFNEVQGIYSIDGREIEPDALIDIYVELCKTFHLVSIEDPFHEEDFEHFALLKKSLNNVQIVGDDLITTNPKRIKKAIEHDSISAALIKINQIGTVSETIQSIQLARKHNLRIIVSHRSGETCDDFIADFSVGMGAEEIKSGAPCRGERLAKYNRLLEIERDYALNLRVVK